MQTSLRVQEAIERQSWSGGATSSMSAVSETRYRRSGPNDLFDGVPEKSSPTDTSTLLGAKGASYAEHRRKQ